MATEVVRCPVVAGRSPEDANSEGGQALKDCLNELSEQPGFQRAYWGLEVENQDIFRLFVDWDSIQAHVDFTKSSGYKDFGDRLGFVLDFPKIQLHHVHFTPHPPEAALSDLSSPTTEILTVWFPSDYSSSDQKTFESNIKKLVAAIESNAKTYRGSAGGWAEEDVAIPDSNGEKGKAYVVLIGWDSVQAHMDFRETQAFKDNISNLVDAKDLKKFTVEHASHLLITRGGGVGDDGDVTVPNEILNPQQGGRQSVKTRADGTTTKNDGGTTNSLKKERQGRA